MPLLPIAKQKYEAAMRELKEVLADFLDAYPADKPISDHDIPDAQERYYSIRQLQGPVAYAVKNLRPQLENNSKAEWNELDRELIDIESQIIGIKLSRGDVFSRFTSVTREVFDPDNALQDRLSHPESNTSRKSPQQTIREKQIVHDAERRIDELRARENEIRRTADIEKDRVALEFNEEGHRRSGE